MDEQQKQLDLLKKIIAPNRGDMNLPVDVQHIEDMIRRKIPETLEKNAPPNFPELYFDFEYVYSKFYDFLLFDKLIGKNIVSLGGGFSSGKSTFLNSLLGKSILPAKIDPSTSVPAYIVREDEVSVIGINEFKTKVELELHDVKTISHGFGEIEDEEGEIVQGSITLGHLLKSLFVATPLQPYGNIAFLDTPGYSKADSADYSAKTDEKIARAQLNASNYILWFVPADAGTLSQEDIRFLHSLDKGIPKLIIINKADKAPGEAVLAEMKQKVKSVLDMKGIKYDDVLTYSRKKDTACDRAQIAEYLQKLNAGREQADFARSFKKLFAECKDYYEDMLNEEKLRLNRLNTALTIGGDNADVNACLSDLIMVIRHNVSELSDLKEQLKKLQQDFFTEIKYIADRVHIQMPEPGEIELIQDQLTDPATVVKGLLRKKNMKTDPMVVNMLQHHLSGIEAKINEQPGGTQYKAVLLDVLKKNLT